MLDVSAGSAAPPFRADELGTAEESRALGISAGGGGRTARVSATCWPSRFITDRLDGRLWIDGVSVLSSVASLDVVFSMVELFSAVVVSGMSRFASRDAVVSAVDLIFTEAVSDAL